MRFVLSIYLIVLAFSLKSQNFKQDLTDLVSQQTKLDKQCYNISYTLRENHNFNSKILHKSLGKYIKTKESFLSSIDHLTSITFSDIIIMLDKEQKTIIVTKNKVKSKAQLDILKQLDEYNKNVEKIITTEISKNKYLYSVELKKTFSPLTKYEIVIDKKNKSLVRLSLFYKGTLPKDDKYKITGNEVPRLDIEFFDYNNFDKLKETECAKPFYYSQNNNKLIPTYNFKDYELKQL